MENEKVNKIRISRHLLKFLETEESELRELIQAGEGSGASRKRLGVIQGLLEHTEIDPTWSDEPTPPEAA